MGDFYCWFPAPSLLRAETQVSLNFTMAVSLEILQLIDRQLELFNGISNFMDNLKKVGKDSINREVLEIRLDRLRKNWSIFEENHMILLSKSLVGSENLDYYKNYCYGTTEKTIRNRLHTSLPY